MTNKSAEADRIESEIHKMHRSEPHAPEARFASQWFEEFFSGIVNELWEQCVSPEQTSAEVDLLQRQLRCKSGRVLDIPCGNGRHCLELARRGYQMTGLDISEEFIAKARNASAQGRHSIEWICSDMRKLSRVAEFDGAFSLGNSFGYLEHDDTTAFLKAVSRALKPKARFLLQAGVVAECLLPRFREREWHRIGDILFLEDSQYRVETSCVDTEYTFVRDGKVEQRRGKQYLYTVGEIRRMLADAGLERVAFFSTSDERPFSLGDPVVHIVAEKVSTSAILVTNPGAEAGRVLPAISPCWIGDSC